jgi:predicted ribosome quality control (RQC) complex YloA/Tae2 family protein
MLEEFYGQRDRAGRLRQRTADLRRAIQSNLDRCRRKSEIYEKSLREIADRDMDRIRGDVLMAGLYQAKKGMTVFEAPNFYSEDGETISIRLDPELTPAENAQAYFKKYAKAKRTIAAVAVQKARNQEDIDYLEGVFESVKDAADEADISDVREELEEAGILKRKAGKKGPRRKPSKPLRFVSSDGFEIYAGKNNTQNDFLTMRFAAPGDLWLHAKDLPGSHVIIRTEGRQASDAAIEEAARLAARLSKGRDSSVVGVDYCPKRCVKKPSGAKPGFVVYDHYKTANVSPEPCEWPKPGKA